MTILHLNRTAYRGLASRACAGLVLILLAACGGGKTPTEHPPQSTFEESMGARVAVPEVAICLPEILDLSATRGQCAQVPSDPKRLSSRATIQTSAAITSANAEDLLNWAETQFPHYFPGPGRTTGAAGFVYRYYPATRNYLGVTDDASVYVLGSSTGNVLVYVGKVADLVPDPAASANTDSLLPMQTGAFSLPVIETPLAHAPTFGTQKGRVFLDTATDGPFGLRVDLIDASAPSGPRVMASAVTSADGSFSINANFDSVAPVDQWLQITTGDKTVLRAFASGWTELTPGTEVAVREIVRLRKAGAFTRHPLTVSELSMAQETLSFIWQAKFSSYSINAALDVLVMHLRFHPEWNKLLDKFGLDEPGNGAGDIAGLVPVSDVTWPATVGLSIGSTAVKQTSTSSSCFERADRDSRDCMMSYVNESGQGEQDQMSVLRTGIRLKPIVTGKTLGSVLVRIGELPVIEFPHLVGTRVIYRNPKLAVDRDVMASVRITRHTYPTTSVSALNGSVQAVKVILDHEIGVINSRSGKRDDFLVRESRWYSPQGGRVRMESIRLSRDGVQTTSQASAMVVNSVNGEFFRGPVLPFAGVMDVRAVALRHRHAIYSKALDRIFVATDTGTGEILELDPSNLSTLRTLAVSPAPSRVALSADGSRLYVGHIGGFVSEFRTGDLSQARRFKLPNDGYGNPYQGVYDLAVDPFDASRVMVLAGQSPDYSGSGAALIYRDGNLLQINAPSIHAGWDYYSPYTIAWSSVRDEFFGAFLGSPFNLYRFRTGDTGPTEVSSLLRTEDIGYNDVAGEILTGQGSILDAKTFAAQRALSLKPFGLRACNRFDADSALCEPWDGFSRSPPYYVHINYTTGALLGTYRPFIREEDVLNGCPGTYTREHSLGLDSRIVTPMGNGRSLVSAGEMCTVQVWTLHGAYP